MVSSAAIAFALGLVGGVIRITFGWNWVWPHRLPSEDGRPGFVLGSIGTLVTSGASGFILWALVTRQFFEDQGFGVSTIAATILVGMGGGDALMGLLDKLLGVTTNQQADPQANQETRAIAEPQAKALETTTQALDRCIEREQETQRENRRLQEEVARLKEDGA